jgi:hypothetical protein
MHGGTEGKPLKQIPKNGPYIARFLRWDKKNSPHIIWIKFKPKTRRNILRLYDKG